MQKLATRHILKRITVAAVAACGFAITAYVWHASVGPKRGIPISEVLGRVEQIGSKAFASAVRRMKTHLNQHLSPSDYPDELRKLPTLNAEITPEGVFITTLERRLYHEGIFVPFVEGAEPNISKNYHYEKKLEDIYYFSERN